ncbi:MAG: diaminopimelate epimerase [Acidobacteria bacterium]|nr:diaminopimelate epimerase [Acidobacteriota bacterium]MCO5332415.1 diaminopimelate epimerase [Pyrinomonadaceae bacterium]
MITIPFYKFHGFGNDYLVIELGSAPTQLPLGELAVAMCRRNTGVGADGVAVLTPLEGDDAEFSCEIINPDGSIAGFSGNGTRCAVACLYYKGIWKDADLRLKMRSGIKNYHLIEKNEAGEYWFNAEIGKPAFASDLVPVLTDTLRPAVVNEPLKIDGRHYVFSAVNVGNPVVCIFVENFDLDWRSIGRQVETHERFPERANVVFVRVIDRGNIEIRIWERGAGETSASGTCATGSAVLSSFLLKAERKVNVHSEGGVTEVEWRDDDEIILKGKAEFVFSGEWMI